MPGCQVRIICISISLLCFIPRQANADIIAVSTSDTGQSVVSIWDTRSNVQVGAWAPGGNSVSDIAFDSATGELYAITPAGVKRRTSSGATESLGYVGAAAGFGGDLIAYDGLVYISASDTGQNVVSIWDTRSNVQVDAWAPGGNSVSDIALDTVTGDLYAITTGDVKRRTSSGATESLGYGSAPAGFGGDLAFNSFRIVPEPNSAFFFGTMTAFVLLLKRRRRETPLGKPWGMILHRTMKPTQYKLLHLTQEVDQSTLVQKASFRKNELAVKLFDSFHADKTACWQPASRHHAC